jgi:hypothetical protein
MKSGYIALGALGAVMLVAAAISPKHEPAPVNVVIHDEPYCAVASTTGDRVTLRKLHHGQCVSADFTEAK